MKKWIIISWDLVNGKGTALEEFEGTYEEAAKHAKEEWGDSYDHLTVSGVI